MLCKSSHKVPVVHILHAVHANTIDAVFVHPMLELRSHKAVRWRKEALAAVDGIIGVDDFGVTKESAAESVAHLLPSKASRRSESVRIVLTVGGIEDVEIISINVFV